MNDTAVRVAGSVIASVFILFYLNRTWRTCSNCEAPGLHKTGRRPRGIDGGQIEYICTYCGAQEWNASLIPPRLIPGLRVTEGTWEQVARERGGRHTKGSFHTDTIVAPVKKWTVRLWTEEGAIALGGGGTHMQVPYVSTDGFVFDISPIEPVYSFWGETMAVVEVGHPEIDHTYAVRAKDETKVRALLANPRIRQLIPKGHMRRFAVLVHNGFQMLRLEATGRVCNVQTLRAWFELFEETLNQLVVIGSASEEPPIVPPEEPAFAPF